MDHNAIERKRWGGPSPFAGKDSRTDVQKLMDAREFRAAWRTDRPHKSGYYLAAWKRAEDVVVSELWFNPDSHGSGWWPSRGYLHQDWPSKQPVEVVAWLPMPKFTEETRCSLT